MQTILLVIVLAAALAGFFLFQHGKLKLPDKLRGSANNVNDAARDLKLELEMMADLAVERMEEKIARMDVLIKEAQEKSNQLDAKIKLVNILQKEWDLLAAKKEEPLLVTETKKESTPQELEAETGSLPGNGFLAETQEPLSEEIFPEGAGIFYSDKHRTALMMIQEGYETDDIAKVTGLTRGEIMLMKGLHDKNKQEGNWQRES